MSKKTLLIIAAVAVMLVGATNAYGYHEVWNGWFNSGYLTFLGSDTFDYVEGQSTVEDITAGSVDSFVIRAILYRSFYCATTGYTIRLWVTTASGSKDTGQSGQKEVNRGATWSGFARLYDDENNLRETFDVGGTWNTLVGGDCFNYGGTPPIYSAEWDMTDSEPDGLEGAGGSSGELME